MSVDPHLPLALGQVVRGFRAEWGARMQALGYSFSLVHYHALLLIEEQPGLHLQGIAEHCALDKANITRMAKELVAQHLVRREPDPNDRRCARLELTDEGRHQLAELKAVKESLNEQMYGHLSPEEQRLLSDLLNKALRRPTEG
ncbi:MAG: MarR family transcriptional regulator [Verrucomicrobiota bacterium JB022]|nr:MarR family transcriptional regulator [Verrucomicrobiota bacterium JB022]